MLKFRLPLLLLTVSLLGQASPISYNINFTGGSTPILGSFTYDDAVPSFSNFEVVWNATTFNLTNDANTGPSSGPCISSSGAAGSFQILSDQVAPGCTTGWTAIANGGIAILSFSSDSSVFGSITSWGSGATRRIDSAAFDITIAAVPEPSTAGVTLLVLAGFGIAAKRRRRR